MRERLADEYFDGVVVDDVAGIVQHAVLAVAGVWVQRHVGEHAQVREFLLQLAHHARNQPVGVQRFFAVGCL
ncbi:hypothetical protein SDC9_93882 [bioreactor metagenome]|uniref:Uncharacterized protein n=1 Tax=bioreactor metagenome TaxID=1076179 RepID=A0A645ABV6_9ZZZZ